MIARHEGRAIGKRVRAGRGTVFEVANEESGSAGYSWEVGTRFRVDRPRLSDLEEVAAAHDAAGRREWWRATARWFEEAPDRVTVLRDAAGRLAGYGIDVTIANAPPFAARDQS